MKIALCLSGKPRAWQKGYQYLKNNLLDHHEVDVFIHTWSDVDDGDFGQIDYTYEPKYIQTTRPFNLDGLKKYPDANPDWPSRNVVHMFYSIFKANEYKREYELDQGFTYDVVIRSRFDFALNRLLPLNEMDKDKVYVPKDMAKGRIAPNGIICNDQFAYGDSGVMDLYCNTFWNIDRAVSLGCPMIGEDLLSVNLQINQIIGEKMVYIDMNHPFPPGKYNITPHSLLRDD